MILIYQLMCDTLSHIDKLTKYAQVYKNEPKYLYSTRNISFSIVRIIPPT